MKKIFLITDYLNRFESKHDDFPYRSGMDKDKLKQYFYENDFEAIFTSYSDIDFHSTRMIGYPVLYTSQEDTGLFYKGFIEDIIYGLELSGANVIPPFKYLMANNNKVFMEILRDKLLSTEDTGSIKSYYFGTLEEAKSKLDKLDFPIVIKGAAGAMSSNVYLAKNKKEAIKVIKDISSTISFRIEIKEFIRSIKYRGYRRQSSYRKKFIIQKFIPNLQNDWKVYVFGSKIFVFYRPVFNNRGFRASGGGYDNYFYGSNALVPEGLFDFAFKIFQKLNTPFVSLDIALANGKFYLLEFQLVYFGTAGILKKYSKEYFTKDQTKQWVMKPNVGDIEKVYVESVVEYLNK